MAVYRQSPRVPIETYFRLEDAAVTKSEYCDGMIIAMSGSSRAHVRITTRLNRLIDAQLDGKPCEPFDSDLRVFAERCNAVYYPDLTVVCEPPQFAATGMATLLNPTLIVEVLSPSTESFDRRIKFDCYRSIDTLKQYVLISQDEPRIETYTRQFDSSWRYEVASGLEASARFESIGCVLQLAEVYARVEFPVEPQLEDLAE